MAINKTNVARVSATSRTAVYGPVHTVVWEGRSCEAPPYPDRSDFVRWPIASFRCAAEFGRYRGIADSSKPTDQQIYGFAA
jgi:hypothetical protein